MVTAEKALEYLLDRDGGTRDITFTPVSRGAVESFLKHLLSDYSLESAVDKDGEDVASSVAAAEFNEVFDRGSGYINATLSSDSAIIRTILIFIDWAPEDAGFCIEVSFFPEDTSSSRFTLASFLSMLQDWNKLLNADDYFVRYENASWQLYDSGGLGVIFTRRRPPLISS